MPHLRIQRRLMLHRLMLNCVMLNRPMLNRLLRNRLLRNRLLPNPAPEALVATFRALASQGVFRLMARFSIHQSAVVEP